MMWRVGSMPTPQDHATPAHRSTASAVSRDHTIGMRIGRSRHNVVLPRDPRSAGGRGPGHRCDVQRRGTTPTVGFRRLGFAFDAVRHRQGHLEARTRGPVAGRSGRRARGRVAQFRSRLRLAKASHLGHSRRPATRPRRDRASDRGGAVRVPSARLQHRPAAFVGVRRARLRVRFVDLWLSAVLAGQGRCDGVVATARSPQSKRDDDARHDARTAGTLSTTPRVHTPR